VTTRLLIGEDQELVRTGYATDFDAQPDNVREINNLQIYLLLGTREE